VSELSNSNFFQLGEWVDYLLSLFKIGLTADAGDDEMKMSGV